MDNRYELIKGIDILSIEAKDLYISHHLIDESSKGYNIRYAKGINKGKYNLNRYINTLDYSLELLKLIDIYEDSFKRKKFYFKENTHNYSNVVINVTFKYSVKLFNKINANTYVKLGYDINNLEVIDNVCVVNNEVVAVTVANEVISPIPKEVLGKHFYYDEDNKTYIAKSNIPTTASTYELREWLYKNGFTCDGTKYVRYKRSSGSSRVGKCLFIEKSIYPQIHKWELCGLDIKRNKEIDLASFEAYISLTMSSIIGTLEIETENILIIDDYESVFKEEAVVTKIDNGELVTREEETEIVNSIWDGQSLMDISLFEEYERFGMVLLRNKFFKSCCFNTNIQQWFKDNDIYDISQLNGYTSATRIEDVKFITTASSIKYLKFGSLEDWLLNIDSTFGVVKHEKKTHHLNGNLVATHYQLINTVQLSKDEVVKFIDDTFEYYKQLRDEPSVLRNHIRYSLYDNDFETYDFESMNAIVYRLLGINNDFSKTEMYDKFKAETRKSFRNMMRRGKILIEGNYSTLCGNPISMLKQSIGKFTGETDIERETVFSSRFKFDQELIGSRSPHVTPGCILLTKNKYYKDIELYMNYTNEIIYVNSINENLLYRLSGAD